MKFMAGDDEFQDGQEVTNFRVKHGTTTRSLSGTIHGFVQDGEDRWEIVNAVEGDREYQAIGFLPQHVISSD